MSDAIDKLQEIAYGEVKSSKGVTEVFRDWFTATWGEIYQTSPGRTHDVAREAFEAGWKARGAGETNGDAAAELRRYIVQQLGFLCDDDNCPAERFIRIAVAKIRAAETSAVVHADPTGTTREPPHCPTCACGASAEPSSEDFRVVYAWIREQWGGHHPSFDEIASAFYRRAHETTAEPASREKIDRLIRTVNARMPNSVNPRTRIEIHPSEWTELVIEIQDLRGQLDAAEQHVRVLQAQVASFAPAAETTAPPLAEMSDAGAERLANYVQAFENLKTKSPKELVDLVLEHVIDLKPFHELLVEELCSRVHPGWENDESPQKASVAPGWDANGREAE